MYLIMTIIQGMDNSILIVFSVMGCLLSFILYNILKFVTEKLNLSPSVLENNQHNHQGPQENVEGECCICLLEYVNRVSLLCNHTFCGIEFI